MFDIGWTEMLVVAVVAIIVVGPKDLPGMLRSAGKMIKKVRGMAGDFQRQFDDALKEAELDGVKKSLDDVRSMNPVNQIKDSLNPLKDTARELEQDLKDAAGSDPGQEDELDYPEFDPGDLFDESKRVKAAPAKEKAKTAKAKSKPAKKAKAKAKIAGVRKPAKTASRTTKKAPAATKPAKKPTIGKKPAAKKSARKTARAESA